MPDAFPDAETLEEKISMQVVKTKRLILRPWLESDAEALFKYASDPDVGPRAGWPPHKSVEESLELIKTVFSGEGMWAVELKETSEVIGSIGYLPSSASNLDIEDDQCEIGYWIAKPYWNKGICTEALQTVVDFSFGVNQASRPGYIGPVRTIASTFR